MTKRAKDDNAGQPETTQRALQTRSRKRDDGEKLRRKMLCRLTLELSGGAAVRLERNVRPHARDAMPASL
jgi:hypothetical protein